MLSPWPWLNELWQQRHAQPQDDPLSPARLNAMMEVERQNRFRRQHRHVATPPADQQPQHDRQRLADTQAANQQADQQPQLDQQQHADTPAADQQPQLDQLPQLDQQPAIVDAGQEQVEREQWERQDLADLMVNAELRVPLQAAPVRDEPDARRRQSEWARWAADDRHHCLVCWAPIRWLMHEQAWERCWRCDAWFAWQAGWQAEWAEWQGTAWRGELRAEEDRQYERRCDIRGEVAEALHYREEQQELRFLPHLD